MKDVCWGSLSYCCSLEQDCPDRDKVIKKLNLTKDDFLKLKKKFDKELEKLIKIK